MSRRLVLLTDAHQERPWATPRYLRRLVAQRSVPFFKLRGRIWIDLADLDTFAEAARVEPPVARRDRGPATTPTPAPHAGTSSNRPSRAASGAG